MGRGRDADAGARLERFRAGPVAAAAEPGDAPALRRLRRLVQRGYPLATAVVLAEGLAEVLTGVAEHALQPLALHRGRDALEPGLAHLAEVAHDHEGAAEHGQEPDEAHEQVRGEGRQEDDEPKEEPHGRPLDVAGGVTVERRLRDLLRQLRIVGVELRFDLVEDSLLVFGKGHRFRFRTVFEAWFGSSFSRSASGVNNAAQGCWRTASPAP